MPSASAEPFPISFAWEQQRPVRHEPPRPLRLCDLPLPFLSHVAAALRHRYRETLYRRDAEAQRRRGVPSASAGPFPISFAWEQQRPVRHEPPRPLRLCDLRLLFLAHVAAALRHRYRETLYRRDAEACWRQVRNHSPFLLLGNNNGLSGTGLRALCASAICICCSSRTSLDSFVRAAALPGARTMLAI